MRPNAQQPRRLRAALSSRSAALVSLALFLPACSLFDDTDPREGVEAADACVQRVTAGLSDEVDALLGSEGRQLTPTYTYDITKLGLEGLQTLTVPGSDETAGARLIASTNEISTAVARFKAQSVDERGAFFMATDPALYRVRGQRMPVERVIAGGCEAQLAGMRLIDVSLDLPGPQPARENVEVVE